MSVLLFGLLAIVGASAGSADVSPRGHGGTDTEGHSTLEQTIVPVPNGSGFTHLELGAGEPYVVREELAQAQGGRETRRTSLIYSGQITDFQLPDEESPSRVEFFEASDPTGATESAHRPQEALVVHEIEESIRQLNLFAAASPVEQGEGGRATMQSAVMTGDLADNQQLNETRWVQMLLSGGDLTPNSGIDDFSDCLVPPTGQTADPALYAGVQDYGDYPVDPGPNGNAFWDPDDVRGDFSTDGWPTYPGLLDRAQEEFTAEGVQVPTYVVFGNHDIAAQGTQATLGPFEDVGIGCVKPLAEISDLPFGLGGPGLQNPTNLAGLLANQVMIVPPDPARQYVDKAQFKSIFTNGPQADGNGFAFVDPTEESDSNGAAGYYAFDAAPGVRYVVLDTPSEGGLLADLAAGNIDDPQFQWLEGELEAASDDDKLIVVWGHHTISTLSALAADEAHPCTVDEPDDSHDVNGIRHDVNPGCDRDPRPSTPVHDGDELTALFNQFPHVVGYVAGHSHHNRVDPRGSDSFWEVASPAIADWPPQHRLIELMDNEDCTLSIFATMLDHAAPTSIPADEEEAGSFGVSELGAIGRTVTFNDPEHPEEDRDSAEGEASDRNVELLIEDPRAECASNGGGGNGGGGGGGDNGGGGGGSGGDRGGGAAGSATSGGGGALPFTGLALLPLLLLGLALLALGRAVRRLERTLGAG